MSGAGGTLAGTGGPACPVPPTPRSSYSTACMQNGLDVIPADGSAARRIGHGEFGPILELAVAPDGRTAAVACTDGRLLTVALEGEPVITEIAHSAIEWVTGLAFSPDSALLAWSQP
jgi:tricorn protease